MKNQLKFYTARIDAEANKSPGAMPIFRPGWNEIEGQGRVLVDEQSAQLIRAAFDRRGNDLVVDYEHQTLTGQEAPAAGWINGLAFSDKGLSGYVDWTDRAKQYIKAKEYRYYSPVFYVRDSDKRVVGLHSIALTNSPKTNHLQPILAKLTPDQNQGENMERIRKALGLDDSADEAAILDAIRDLKKKVSDGGDKDEKPKVAKDILAALDLDESGGVSAVVAGIHALKQEKRGSVTRQEYESLQQQIRDRDAREIVAKAMADGKITPDQKDWAQKYAAGDLEGFKLFVAKAPQVIPMGGVPAQQETAETGGGFDDAVLQVAKMMDISKDDLKKYGGLE